MSLLYLYGIIPTEEKQGLPSFKGIDDEHDVEIIEFGKLSAVVCSLDESEYGEEALNKKTNQIEWVQDRAYHHHESLIKIREKTTIIPMKFCTIYQSEDSLKTMIYSHQKDMEELLNQLADKEEWNVKIYCDRDQLKDKVEVDNETIKGKQAEIAQMSKGRQYLENKKLDQLITQEVEREQERFSTHFHSQLKEDCDQHAVKKIWNKDVTGKNEEMCWNSAYLVPVENVEEFLEKVTEADKQEHGTGWIFEVTGPWPAYHFVNLA